MLMFSQELLEKLSETTPVMKKLCDIFLNSKNPNSIANKLKSNSKDFDFVKYDDNLYYDLTNDLTDNQLIYNVYEMVKGSNPKKYSITLYDITESIMSGLKSSELHFAKIIFYSYDKKDNILINKGNLIMTVTAFIDIKSNDDKITLEIRKNITDKTDENSNIKSITYYYRSPNKPNEA